MATTNPSILRARRIIREAQVSIRDEVIERVRPRDPREEEPPRQEAKTEKIWADELQTE
jgi:hypothetical protein